MPPESSFSQTPSPRPAAQAGWVQQLKRLAGQLHPLHDRLQREAYYRFRSYEELRLAAELGFRLDVNRATVDDWLRLPGLSIHQARTLATLSQSGVQFHCLEDIAAVLGVPAPGLQPLTPVLDFRYYDPDSPLMAQTVAVNQAGLEQLCRLPGMDHALACRVLQERLLRGSFQNVAEFQQRLRLPPTLMEQLLHYLRF